jgi:DNA-binding transcriptional LysR family regulator
MNLAAVDLNLLVAFDAMLVEGSVSRAAQRIGLSQPAMSKRLARLRALFRDDLFVRSGEGIKPTERALDLADAIRSALRQIVDALGVQGRFDAPHSARAFRIGTMDHMAALLLPCVITAIRARAPRAVLIVRTMDRRELTGALDRGDIDVALAVLPDAPSTIKRAALFEERYLSLVSARHPAIKKKLTLALFLEYPHLLITHIGDLKGVVDRLLDERGLKRHVAMSLPYQLAAPAIIADTDMIATMSERVARLSAWPGVRAFPVPIEFPSFRETMLWHRRSDNDPAHAWLRGLILAASETIDKTQHREDGAQLGRSPRRRTLGAIAGAALLANGGS